MWVFMKGARYICPALAKTEFDGAILVKTLTHNM